MNRKSAYCLLAALALASCLKEADTGIPDGMLRANIVQPEEETRTSFDGGTGKFRWSEGDRIAIHMSTGYFTEVEVDYRTGFFECPTTESRRRDFYAVYPASIAVEGAYGNPDLDVTLPAEYDISDKLTSDYSPLPMIARNREEESDLWFNHAGGLIRIILNDVPATAQKVRVTFEHNVTGTYRVNWTGDLLPYIADGGDNAVVIFRLAESTLGAVTNGIRINVPVPTGHYGEVKVEVLDGSGTVLSTVISDIDWDCRRGHGKLFEMETSAYTLDCYGYSITANTAKSLRAGWVRSYRYKSGSDTAEAVSWHVGGYFSDAACTTPYDGEDASNAPYWLTSFGDNGTGAGSPGVAYVPAVYEKTHSVFLSETYLPEAQEIDARIAASSFGTGSSPFHYLNLANPSDMNSDYIAESANCYIVNGTGYFRIPLVMGNGVIDNQVNPEEKVYNAASYYHDYKGNSISSPYIHESSAGVGVPTGAFVVWEDVGNLIEVLNEEDFTLPGTPVTFHGNCYWLNFHVAKAQQGNAVIAVTDADGTVMWSWHIWVTDYVPKNYGGNGEIAVTPFDPSYRYEMMPVNLGYVVSGMRRTYNYLADEVYVKIVQDGGIYQAMKLTRTEAPETKKLHNDRQPYFQWGRKDALHPAVYEGISDWSGRYPVLGFFRGSHYIVSLEEMIQHPQCFVSSNNQDNSEYWFTDSVRWVPRALMWSAYAAGPGPKFDMVTKTIYDPCPAGYSMPPSGAFSGFTPTGESCSLGESNMVDLTGDGEKNYFDYASGLRGLYFYTDASKTSTIFFPCTGRLSVMFGMSDGIYEEDEYNTYAVCQTAGYWIAPSIVNCSLVFSFDSNGVYPHKSEYNGLGCPVRPVINRREVFGGNGNSGATTTGVQIDNYDMGGNMWE